MSIIDWLFDLEWDEFKKELKFGKDFRNLIDAFKSIFSSVIDPDYLINFFKDDMDSNISWWNLEDNNLEKNNTEI